MKTWRILHCWQFWVIVVLFCIAAPFASYYALISAPSKYAAESAQLQAIIRKQYPEPLTVEAVVKPEYVAEQPIALKRSMAVDEAFGGRPARLHLTSQQAEQFSLYLEPVRQMISEELPGVASTSEQRLVLNAGIHLLQMADPGSTVSESLFSEITSATSTMRPDLALALQPLALKSHLLTVLQLHAERADTSESLRAVLQQVRRASEAGPPVERYLRPALIADEEDPAPFRYQAAVHQAAMVKPDFTPGELMDPTYDSELSMSLQMNPHSPYIHPAAPRWTVGLLNESIFQKLVLRKGMPSLGELTGIPELDDATLEQQAAFYGNTVGLAYAQDVYLASRIVATQQQVTERWVAEKLYHMETGQWAPDTGALTSRYQLNWDAAPATPEQFMPLTYPMMQAHAAQPLGSAVVRQTQDLTKATANLVVPGFPHSEAFSQAELSSTSTRVTLRDPLSQGVLLLSAAACEITMPRTVGLHFNSGLPYYFQSTSSEASKIATLLYKSVSSASHNDPAFDAGWVVPAQYGEEAIDMPYSGYLFGTVDLPSTITVITYDGPRRGQWHGTYTITRFADVPELIHPRDLEQLKAQ